MPYRFLTHFWAVLQFLTPSLFSGIFRWYKIGTLPTNGLIEAALPKAKIKKIHLYKYNNHNGRSNTWLVS